MEKRLSSLALVLLLGIGPSAQTIPSVPANPDDGKEWLELARQRLAAKEFPEAIAAYRRAGELGSLSPADVQVEIAATEAAAGRRTKALTALEAALTAGYRSRERLDRDSRFQGLSADPRWKKIVGARIVAAPGSAAAWRADLDFLVSEIQRIHPRYRIAPLPAEFSRIEADLRRRVGTLPPNRIVVEMQKLLATLADGHTLLWPFGMKIGELKRIPLSLWWFEDGVSVVGADDPSLLGARVLRVGRMSATDALKRLEAYVSRDNPMQVRLAAPVYLVLTDYLEAIGAISARDAAEVEFLTRGGDSRTVRLRSETVDPEKLATKLPPGVAEGPLYLRNTGEPFWWRRLSDGVFYVQLNAIVNGAGKSLADFAKELRAELLARQPAHLILDLRHNNGGDAGLADEMLRTLVAYDAGGGRVWVLIGRVTFSAAETLAARLDQWTGATFVGEPSGSRPNHFGNEATFRLPHSGVRGTISSGWNQPVTARDERIWIAPDISVKLSSDEYFSGRDPVLDRVLREIGPGVE